MYKWKFAVDKLVFYDACIFFNTEASDDKAWPHWTDRTSVTSVPLNWVLASRQLGHDEGEFWIKGQSWWCVQVLVLLSLFVVANLAAEDLPQEKDLICDICQEIVSFLLLPASRHFQMDQVTQFDAFLTSDPTEAQITEWVKSICHMLAEVWSLKARKTIEIKEWWSHPNQVT